MITVVPPHTSIATDTPPGYASHLCLRVSAAVLDLAGDLQPFAHGRNDIGMHDVQPASGIHQKDPFRFAFGDFAIGVMHAGKEHPVFALEAILVRSLRLVVLRGQIAASRLTPPEYQRCRE